MQTIKILFLAILFSIPNFAAETDALITVEEAKDIELIKAQSLFLTEKQVRQLILELQFAADADPSLAPLIAAAPSLYVQEFSSVNFVSRSTLQGFCLLWCLLAGYLLGDIGVDASGMELGLTIGLSSALVVISVLYYAFGQIITHKELKSKTESSNTLNKFISAVSDISYREPYIKLYHYSENVYKLIITSELAEALENLGVNLQNSAAS